jgi:serine/threonine-protein kinase HipA
MAARELFVFANLADGFVPAGRLTLTETSQAVTASGFAYGTRYRRRPGRFEIDPVSLSLTDLADGAELFPAHGLREFGAIRDAAPDSWGRRLIEAQRRVPANSLPESEYLLGAGSDRVGAIDVRTSLLAGENRAASPERSLAYLLEATERIEAGEALPSKLHELFASGPTAGGARPKASVRDENGLLWLAKFPSRTDPFDMTRTEWATLQLAARCGLTVPPVRIVEFSGKPVMLIRRFDRYWAPCAQLAQAMTLHETLPGEGRREYRLPFVSGLTLIACDEMESPTKAYADLARAIRSYAHVSMIRHDNRELFARMVFNIMVSNDDDHLRNHGFIRDPRLPGWRLSPLYDVVPRPSVAHERQLHLAIGDQGRYASLDNAVTSRAAFSLERPEAVAVIAKVVRGVSGWRDFYETLGLKARLLEQIGTAFRSLDHVASPQLRSELEASQPHRLP